jgi:cytochrome oxidase Cu insertion factor (SCO1/SenC/PrrC family)
MKGGSAAHRRLTIFAIVLPIFAVASVSIGYALGTRSAPADFSSGPFAQLNVELPQRLADIPLENQDGQRTDLRKFRGREVVLADFMSSCQEECPITTGALLEVQQALARARDLRNVSIVELSVDPRRDTPSRLLAYSKRFGVPFTLLTGTSAHLAEIWKWFGVYYTRVKEDTPPDINWQTGTPYTYDIVHTDDVFILDRSGRERALVQSNADVNGKIPKALATLLDADGVQDLEHPGLGSWTPMELLRAIGSVLGHPI